MTMASARAAAGMASSSNASTGNVSMQRSGATIAPGRALNALTDEMGKTTAMTDAIPKEELKRAERKLARKIAAAIVQAMAETDFNFTQIAARIGRTEKEITAWMARLFDGDGSGAQIDHVSDILLAMECELVVRAVALPMPKSTDD